MEDRADRLKTISDVINCPPFHVEEPLSVADSFAATLLQVSRLPHKYALLYTALGSASHLAAFAGSDEFPDIMRADGGDLSSPSLALTKCLFELMERTWSPLVDDSGLVTGTREALGESALDPRYFALLSEKEYAATGGRYVRYDDDMELSWRRCSRLVPDGEMPDTLVPALLIHPGFGIMNPAQRFVPMLSPGVAAGTRYDEAILRGIYEVIERDAFAISWLGMRTPPRVEIDSAVPGPDFVEVLNDLQGDGFNVEFFDLTLDVEVPVALCMITNERRDERFTASLGLGCHLETPLALEKSLSEALQLMINDYAFPGGVGVERRENGAAVPDEPKDVLRRLTDSRQISVRFTQRNDGGGVVLRAPEQLLLCLERLEAAGLAAYFCDLTPAENDEGTKFCLTRALISGMQPHLYETDCWRLANERLYRVTEISEQDLNLTPNPFVWHLGND